MRKRIFSAFLVGICSSLVYSGTVPVFFSSEVHPKKREKALASAGIADATFVVYDNYSAFETALGEGAEVIIAPSNFSNADYEKILTFTKGGNKTFIYKVLSLDQKWNKGNISNASMGAVAVAGLVEMDGYIKGKGGVNPKIVKTVAKPEDLFPMLALKSSDVIAMEDYIYSVLKSNFGSPVNEVADSNPVDLPSIFIKKGVDAAPIKSVYSAMPLRVIKLLGFDGIQ